MSTSKSESLRDIAQIAYNRHGVAGRGMERIAGKEGLVMSRSTFDRILNGTYASRALPETLDALAFLADVPAERVYRAAKRKYAAAKFSEQLPPDIDLLTDDQRNAVITVARAFLNANRELEGLRNESDDKRQQARPKRHLRTVEDADSQDAGEEQKIPDGIAAYDRELGDGIRPNQLPDD